MPTTIRSALRPLSLLAALASTARAQAAPSCRDDIGAQRAAQLAARCQTLSTATHPPCNAENECSLMLDEIRRTCRVDGCSPAGAELAARAAAVLAQWLAAQAEHDTSAYLALYDSNAFQGIKRTANGNAVSYDFAAWKAERTKMMGQDVTVIAEGARFAVVDDKPAPFDLSPAQPVEVSFVQRFASRHYADHGRKSLRFSLRNGELKIVYEEMQSSAPGWYDAPPWANVAIEDDTPAAKSQRLDGRTLQSPIELRVIGETVNPGGANPRGVVRVELRDRAGVSRRIVLGTFMQPGSGDYRLDLGHALLCERELQWAGAGHRLDVRRAGDDLVVTTTYLQESEGDPDAPTELRPIERVRVSLPKGAVLRAAPLMPTSDR